MKKTNIIDTHSLAKNSALRKRVGFIFSVRGSFTSGRAALCLAAALAASPSSCAQSYAQSEENADAAVLEEVVVKGYRRSLQNSLALKEDSQQIVEVVTAEDIGKLPDVSIAESLARLPGLAAQRLNGRGQVISVRGLSPDFSTALFNGREQVSVGDNRGVEFDQYPSELLSGVVVYKTPDASLLGQGLAGTSDLQSLRPLRSGERILAANVRYIVTDDALNPDGKDNGLRINATYVDKFMGDTLGIALGFASLNNPSQGAEFRGWGYPEVDGNLVLGGHDSLARSSVLERDAFMAVLEYQPNGRAAHTFDVYYSKFVETDLLRGLEGGLQWSDAKLQPGFNASNGFIRSGAYTGVKYVVRNDVESRDADLFAAGYNLDYQINEKWAAQIDLSHSAVDRQDQVLESYSGLGPSDQGFVDRANFRVDGAGAFFTHPAVNYAERAGFVITDPLGWGGGAPEGQQVGYLNRPSIEDTLNQVTISVERSLAGPISSMEIGVNYKNRKKSKVVAEFVLDIPGNTRENPVRTAPLPVSLGLADLGFLGMGYLPAYDPRDILSSGGFQLLRNENADVTEKSWVVEENVLTAYLQFGIDTELAGRSLSGNFGIQVTRTEQESRALGAQSGNTLIAAPISGGKTFTEVLPSLNLIWGIAENQYLKLGLARTMARPRMDEMRVSRQFSFIPNLVNSSDPNRSPWGGSGGNPELDPWLANSFDISYEWYFADRAGYMALAYFYKDLDSYVFNANEQVDFSALLSIIGGLRPAQTSGFLNRPVNGQGGTVEGFEAALTVTSEMFADAFPGLGLTVNYTSTGSAVKADPNDAQTITLPGLSDKVWNATLFYEIGGFSARVSQRYRADFLGEIQGFGANREFRTVAEEAIIDAQISYEIQTGSMAGLTFYLQGNNLSDEPFVTYNSEDDPRQIINYEKYGPSYLLGASYKF